MDSCLSYNSHNRPTFLEIRKELQHYADEDYYISLDYTYNTLNELLEAEVESECEEQSNLTETTPDHSPDSSDDSEDH